MDEQESKDKVWKRLKEVPHPKPRTYSANDVANAMQALGRALRYASNKTVKLKALKINIKNEH